MRVRDSPAGVQGVDGPAHAQQEDGQNQSSRQNFESSLPAEEGSERTDLKIQTNFFIALLH